MSTALRAPGGAAWALPANGLPTVVVTEPRWRQSLRAMALRVAGIAGLIAGIVGVWQVWVVAGNVATIIAPRPGAVGADLVAQAGTYLTAVGQTLMTAGIGLVAGLFTGTGLAVLAWWSPITAGLSRPIAAFIRTVPLVAVVPVIARLLGYGPQTTVVVTAVIAFFPSYVLVSSGMRTLPAGAADVLRALGCGRMQALRRLVLPSAGVSFLVALRIAVTLCIFAAVAAEFITGVGGLGRLFNASRIDYSNTARAWGVAVVSGALSFVLYALASWAERLGRERLT